MLEWLSEVDTALKVIAGIVGSAAVIGGAFFWILKPFRKPVPTPLHTDQTPARELAEALAKVSEDKGRAEADFQSQLGQKDTQIDQLTETIEALRAETSISVDQIANAEKHLENGDTEAAKGIFKEVLKRQKSEGQQSFKQAAAAARHLGALAFLNDTQEALAAYAEATELDPDDPDGWNQLGRLQKRLGGLDAAIRSFEHVLALGNQAEDQMVIAAATGNLGLIYKTRGDLDWAEDMLRKSLELSTELGLKEGMARQYGNLGLIYQIRGDLDEAEKLHRKSLDLHTELGIKEGMASDYGNLGNVKMERGELDEAEEMHSKSLVIETELGRNEGMASDYGNLGIIYQIRGELDEAEKLHRKSLEIETELGRKEGMAQDYSNLGTEKNDIAGACEIYSKALALFHEVGMAPEVERTKERMRRAGCGELDENSSD